MYQVHMYREWGPGQVEYKEFSTLSEVFEYLKSKEPIKFASIRRIGHEYDV